MEQLKRRGQKRVTLSILFILSGIMLDSYDLILNIDHATWLILVNISKDLQIVGFSIISYTLCPFSRLKLKTFLFMMCIWRTFVLIANPLEFYSIYSVSIFYSIYIYWLLRVYLVDTSRKIQLTGGSIIPLLAQESYNIFVPVSSFRGLLKALFIPFSKAYYETTIIVHKGDMYFVKNNSFVKRQYMDEKVKDLIESGHAYVQSCKPTKKQIKKIDKLVGKKSITGIRDCRRLKI